MFENVRGMLAPAFDDYRSRIETRLHRQNYQVWWKLLNASDYGVPQLRPRVVMVALKHGFAPTFEWPLPIAAAPTVGERLFDLMAENGWAGAADWRKGAGKIAPTIVGGSKKHGGPDLGPTRAKTAWAALGVNGKTIAVAAPPANHQGMPQLTVRMAARIQGFPDSWQFSGKKTSAYRQVGNAFPPPVAQAVGSSILNSILSYSKIRLAA